MSADFGLEGYAVIVRLCRILKTSLAFWQCRTVRSFQEATTTWSQSYGISVTKVLAGIGGQDYYGRVIHTVHTDAH